MSKVLVTESNLQDIADAIRSKNEGTDTYRPGDMAAAILAIPAGGTLVSKTITQNGEYDPEDDNADGYSDVTVNVPNSYTAEDEGKVVSSGALVAQTGLSVTQNGTYDTTENNEVIVNVSGGTVNLQSKTVTENGTVTPDAGYDGLSSVVVNVQGGGGESTIKGFELYAADGYGSQRNHKGVLDNQYFVCYFDDNINSAYTLNGQTYTFAIIAAGKQQTLGTTRAVTDNQNDSINSVMSAGSSFAVTHLDSGSYVSVVGGWVGYPTGGAIFENASTGTSNSITLDAVYDKLLVFIGGCFNSDGVTSVEINGVTYTIANIGYHYGAYGVYGAIEIENNSDTTITAVFPNSGWSYMSIIGING